MIKIAASGRKAKADQLALAYIGAATLVLWNYLPLDVRAQLRHTVSGVAGLPAIANLDEQIGDLIRRYTGAE
jgi:hypothetical protein